MIKRKETTLTNGFLEINHKASTIYAIEIDDANDDDDDGDDDNETSMQACCASHVPT